MHLLLLVTLILNLNICSCESMRTFLSINSNHYRSYQKSSEVEHLNQLLSLSNIDEPLIILHFNKFALFNKLNGEKPNYTIIDDLYNVEMTSIPGNDYEINKPGIKLMEIDRLPVSNFNEVFFDINKDDSVIVFQFNCDDYDIDSLNEFLEKAYLFLSDKITKFENILIQCPYTDRLNSELRDHSEISDLHLTKQYHGSEDNGIKKNNIDIDDRLSSIWTEGLLSCLLISGILILILMIAISWISSLTISYGALEKSTNPLKKMN